MNWAWVIVHMFILKCKHQLGFAHLDIFLCLFSFKNAAIWLGSIILHNGKIKLYQERRLSHHHGATFSLDETSKTTVATCRRNMVGSLPMGMPKVVDCRQTDAQATNKMVTQDRHEVLSRFGHREGVIPMSCV